MFGQRGAARVSIESLAGIIGMQRDDALKRTRLEFGLQQADFRLAGIFPELTVQIPAAASKAGAVLEAGRIADGINGQVITGGELGPGFEQLDEVDECVDAFGFITMNAGENADANGRVAAARADKQIARQHVTFAIYFKTRVVIGNEVGRMRGDLFQWRQQVGDGTALFARRRRCVFYG